MGYGLIDRVTQKYGAEDAKEVVTFLAKHMYAMKYVAEKEEIDCDYTLDRYVETFLDQSDADHVMEVYDAQFKAELDYIQDVDVMNPKYVERVSSPLSYPEL
jgi:hypothetical protein